VEQQLDLILDAVSHGLLGLEAPARSTHIHLRLPCTLGYQQQACQQARHS